MEPTGNSIEDVLVESEGELSSYRGQKALYVNSPLAEAVARAQAAGEVPDVPDEDKFFNEKDPRWSIKTEKPEHRVMLYMRARGASYQEIAEQMGSTPAWVSNVLRQPWAKLRLAHEINAAGRDDVSNLIESAAKDSLHKLIALRDSADAAPNVQADVSKYLVDRFLGKPKQSIKQELIGDPGKMTDAQLATIAGTGLTSTGNSPAGDAEGLR